MQMMQQQNKTKQPFKQNERNKTSKKCKPHPYFRPLTKKKKKKKNSLVSCWVEIKAKLYSV